MSADGAVQDPGRSFVLTVEPFDAPDAQRLRAVARMEVDRLYGGYPDRGAPLDSSAVIVTVVARDSAGAPLGCGSLTAVDDGVLELRRFFVRSDARGTGVAAALLAELESAARAGGAPAMVCEVADRQAAAIRFFEREGFSRIASFGPYAANAESVCFAKTLL
ncbi:GNAT family N-acetyltransferase [Curtobacterium ammoniigenes]|uniref:GNAT family N-acetyltransferase n=1 Tax=Curtobacterium ammoniigenes TaxID=395387 RepID=UPI000829822F|nr:GNAT family N-acetyltransferase [Curtobacterium ammoniigenes]